MLKRCRVCGAEYDSCYSCEKTHSWRTLTDTAEHYYILGVLMAYQTNRDADSAYNALCKRGVDFQDIGHFLPNIQDILVEIYVLANPDEKKERHEERYDEYDIMPTFDSDEE